MLLISKQALFSNIKEFEAATKLVQDENNISLADVRSIFDSLMQLQFVANSDFGKKHLLRIVQSPEFETGIVKLCNNEADSLSFTEKEALKDFIIENMEVSSGDDCVPVALWALKSWIPPTSNCVERFFSVCNQVYADYRKRLQSVILEMQLFLKINSRFWAEDIRLASQAVIQPEQDLQEII